MIIRIFRAKIRPGRAQDFERRARALSVPLVRRQPGLLAFFPGRPLLPSDDEFTMVTVWDSLDSLKAFTGEKWGSPFVPDDELPLIEGASVEHFAVYEDSSVGRPDE
jgi:heme-degrading monooxygenase HmoA